MNKGIGGHHSPNRGATDSWITPPHLVEPLGQFDLDPCECKPQPWKLAAAGYTIEDDGLRMPWAGRVWLNPPYSNAWEWLAKLATHGRGTALIFARTETAGFVSHVWKRSTAILFLHGRLHFHHPDGTRATGNSGGPSCLVAYGNEDAAALLSSGIAGSLVFTPSTVRETEVANDPFTP
jgi:hypothetical protein